MPPSRLQTPAGCVASQRSEMWGCCCFLHVPGAKYCTTWSCVRPRSKHGTGTLVLLSRLCFDLPLASASLLLPSLLTPDIQGLSFRPALLSLAPCYWRTRDLLRPTSCLWTSFPRPISCWGREHGGACSDHGLPSVLTTERGSLRCLSFRPNRETMCVRSPAHTPEIA